jgi:hypothetical protein
VGVTIERDESLALECAEQAAEVAGVETEPEADGPQVRVAGELVEQAGLAERTLAQIAVRQYADPLGVVAVELPDATGDQLRSKSI